MNAEPKIVELKFTHVLHGLERLTKFGFLAHLWNRIRFDDAFAERVCHLLVEENKAMLGKRFTATLQKRYNRFELNELLIEKGMKNLRETVVRSLLPLTPEMDQSDIVNIETSFEWYVVDPGYPMDEEAARLELERRDLVPANTEDGFAFMLAHNDETRQCIYVLDSWREDCGRKECLLLAQTVSGVPMVSVADDGGSMRKFLAKKPHK